MIHKMAMFIWKMMIIVIGSSLMGNLMGICRSLGSLVLARPPQMFILVVWLHGLSSIPIYEHIDTGWWFGTCFIFPYIGNNDRS
jgi:hypothetical protein